MPTYWATPEIDATIRRLCAEGDEGFKIGNPQLALAILRQHKVLVTPNAIAGHLARQKIERPQARTFRRGAGEAVKAELRQSFIREHSRRAFPQSLMPSADRPIKVPGVTKAETFGAARISMLVFLARGAEDGVWSGRISDVALARGLKYNTAKAILLQLITEIALKPVLYRNAYVGFEIKIQPDAYKPETQRKSGGYVWTDQGLANLRVLWTTRPDLSAAQICVELGLRPEARFAVISKAHRLGLPSRPRPSPIRPKVAKEKRSVKIVLRRQPETIPPKPPTHVSGRASALHFGSLGGVDINKIKAPPKGRCAWPMICHEPTDGHFCEHHRVMLKRRAA